MKKSSILLLLAVFAFAGKEKAPDYSKVLPGVVKVNDGLYFDKTEVSNFNWLEYLHWTKENDLTQYAANCPDTNVWKSQLTYNLPYGDYYLRHVAYRDYPVVGVSWQQANDFCKWRTARIEENLEKAGSREKAPKHFFYRLPTYEEYIMMYSDIAEVSNFIGEEGKKKYRGFVRFNMLRAQSEYPAAGGKKPIAADITAPVLSYWSNSFGVYNIKGNVAEWLAEPSTYVGGAWNTPMTADVTQKQTLDSASAFVGFRCVCEISDEELPPM
ncbi:MAG: formylglycine-generating enzyme family protein [Salibacteraceae bacterium]|nr:formylglycine-generating enzyme family protein [Salibacteraceae bacterium]